MTTQATDTVSQNESGEFNTKLQVLISKEAHTLIRVEAARLNCSTAMVLDMLAKQYLQHNKIEAAPVGAPTGVINAA